MSTFRTILSTVRYHAITRPAITKTRHLIEKGFRKVQQHMKNRQVAAQGRKVGLRAKILNKTRGSLAGNTQAFSKRSITGVKRRQVLAKKLWAARQAGSSPTPTKPAGPSPIRTKVLNRTRGAKASNARLWRKSTIAGSKRRLEAAKAARALPRPKRARTGKLPSTSPVGAHTAPAPAPAPAPAKRKAYPKTNDPVQAAINTSRTHGQLRRKLTGVAVRKLSSSIKGSRSQRAVTLANYRKEHKDVLQKKVKSWKSHYMKKAAGRMADR